MVPWLQYAHREGTLTSAAAATAGLIGQTQFADPLFLARARKERVALVAFGTLVPGCAKAKLAVYYEQCGLAAIARHLAPALHSTNLLNRYRT